DQRRAHERVRQAGVLAKLDAVEHRVHADRAVAIAQILLERGRGPELAKPGLRFAAVKIATNAGREPAHPALRREAQKSPVELLEAVGEGLAHARFFTIQDRIVLS